MMLISLWFSTVLSAVMLTQGNCVVPGVSFTTAPIPTSGLIDYVGKTLQEPVHSYLVEDNDQFYPSTLWQSILTKFNIWKLFPWNRLTSNNNILKLKLGGSLPLRPEPKGSILFGDYSDQEVMDSLSSMTTLLRYAAYDPRISAVFIEMRPFTCGYAKLAEMRRALDFYRRSGKRVVGYCEAADQKTLYVAASLDQLFVPPDGSVETPGFVAIAEFYRGSFEKVGVEPLTKRIGKYKSFGDTFLRTDMSDAQREVTSAILTESSEHWARSMASSLNKSVDEVKSLWADSQFKSPVRYAELGFLSGVRYLDQVETMLRADHARDLSRTVAGKVIHCLVGLFESRAQREARALALQEDRHDLRDFVAGTDFAHHPRRTAASLDNRFPEDVSNVSRLAIATASSRRDEPIFLPGHTYLKKMTMGSQILAGLPVREVSTGPRIAIINAEGGIGSGSSVPGSIGSDTLIAQIREVRDDPEIRAVVLRVNSPGGAALASDLCWRELRRLSRSKPVVASMSDVAGSGGYFLSMACDQIVAEELTMTGSIGIVASRFNIGGLRRKLGLSSDTVSIGRFAELQAFNHRSLTAEEDAHYEAAVRAGYASFVEKAAASRSMSAQDMETVAQGRVWLGSQAITRGLVDRIGGLRTALQLAANLSEDCLPRSYRDHLDKLHDQRALLNGSSKAAKESTSVRYPVLRVETIREPGVNGFARSLRRRVTMLVTEALTSSSVGREIASIVRESESAAAPLASMDSSVQFPSLSSHSGSRGAGLGAVHRVARLFLNALSLSRTKT